MRKILVVLLVFCAVLFVLALRIGGFTSKKSGSISPDILYLTEPVFSFSGQVEKIDGNFITVSQTVYSTPPTPVPVKLSYRIEVNKNTTINRPPINIPYLFITPTSSPRPKLIIKDIIIGRSITVSTNTDLRLVTDNQFTATTVSLPALITTITGKITNIQGNLLTVEAIMPSAKPAMAVPGAGEVRPSPKKVNYQVTVTDNTEISHPEFFNYLDEVPEKPVKISLSDLKIDASIKVYTNEDVILTQNLTAFRIEPIIQP